MQRIDPHKISRRVWPVYSDPTGDVAGRDVVSGAKSDPGASAFGLRNELFADHVVEVRRHPALFEAPVTQETLCAARPLPLEFPSQPAVAVAVAKPVGQVRAVAGQPVAVGRDIDDPEIHAEKPGGLERLGRLNLDSRDQVELPVPVDEIALAALTGELLALPRAAGERDGLAAVHGPERHGYRSANKTLFSAKYLVAWGPKCRGEVLVGPVAGRLNEIIAGVAGGVGTEVLECEVTPDRVHLLVEVPPAVALSRFVQLLKGRTSRRLRREFPHLQRLPCLWSPSWFVSTVGCEPLEVVRRYVENQKRAA